MKLLTEALVKFFCGVLLVMALIFWPAGTFCFVRGWLFMAILFVPMLIAGFVMLAKSPAFLKKRLDAPHRCGKQPSNYP